MSLTEEALYERRWGKFPELARLLDKKREADNYSSVSDNIYEQMNRYFQIFRLIQDNKDDIRLKNFSDRDGLIHEELEELSKILKYFASRFEDASCEISKLNKG
jgi:hypothetical protein